MIGRFKVLPSYATYTFIRWGRKKRKRSYKVLWLLKTLHKGGKREMIIDWVITGMFMVFGLMGIVSGAFVVFYSFMAMKEEWERSRK